MKASEIDILDYMRILFGEMPFEYIPELILRVFIVYVVLVVALRLMGPRMAAQISRNEIIALVTLAASAGILPHNPDRGILPSITVVVLILIFQWFTVLTIKKSLKAESIILDKPATLIKNGLLELDPMKRARIPKERLFSELRGMEFTNLADVERAYIESNGKFTILTYEQQQKREGLCVLPESDNDFRSEMEFSTESRACKTCGYVTTATVALQCERCGADQWERAIVSKPKGN
jgi:uncharacterized membrane protein YcaP (DUF421 family)